MSAPTQPPPLESEADRIAGLWALGAVPIGFPSGCVLGIFDQAFASVPFDLADIEGRTPFLTCRASDVASVRKDDVVKINGAAYRVMRIEPDTPAPGWVVILLRQ